VAAHAALDEGPSKLDIAGRFPDMAANRGNGMHRRLNHAITLFLLLSGGAVSAFAPGASLDQAAALQDAQGSADSSTDPGPVRPIGIIDFYGLRQLTAEKLRNELTFKVGDSVKLGDHSYSFFAASKQRLLMVPGVVDAHVDVICCTDGRPVAFVGIQETNAPLLQFRPAPTSSVRLPSEVLKTGAEFDQLCAAAASSGNAEEDDSEGHMLLLDVAARPTEDRMIAIANRELKLLREVLRDSADSEHRALAAQLLGYTKNMQSVVPDLVYAMRDSSVDVRNNAMRSLEVFTKATKVKPPRVPYKPFVAMLNSPVWLDRNKSSLALMQLTSTRAPMLLKMLRGQALPSLVEMARWSDRSHAAQAFYILGNLAGVDEETIIDDLWVKNDRERIIQAVLHQSQQ
jgi:hypothetical protein